jgi:hypothetical protein
MVTAAYTVATVVLGLIAYKQWMTQRIAAGYQKAAADATKEAAEVSRKSSELQIQLSLFNLLSDVELSKSRGRIFEKYCLVYGKDRSESEEKNKKLLELYNAIKDDVRIVEGAFDQAGVLVIRGQLEKDVFYELYDLMIIRIYKALKAHIDEEKKNNPAFAYWFAQMGEDAINRYKGEHNSDPPEIYCKEIKPEQ